MIWLYFQPPSQLHISIPLSCKLLFSRSPSPSLCTPRVCMPVCLAHVSVLHKYGNKSNEPTRTMPYHTSMHSDVLSHPFLAWAKVQSPSQLQSWMNLGFLCTLFPSRLTGLSLSLQGTYKFKDRSLIYLTVWSCHIERIKICLLNVSKRICAEKQKCRGHHSENWWFFSNFILGGFLCSSCFLFNFLISSSSGG